MEKQIEIALAYNHARRNELTGKKFHLCIMGSSQSKIWTVIGDVPGEEDYGMLCACDNFGRYEFVDMCAKHIENHPA